MRRDSEGENTKVKQPFGEEPATFGSQGQHRMQLVSRQVGLGLQLCLEISPCLWAGLTAHFPDI